MAKKLEIFRRGYYYVSNIIYYQALGQAACGLSRPMGPGLWLGIHQPKELAADSADGQVILSSITEIL